MVSSTLPKVGSRRYLGPLAVPSLSLARDPDRVLEGHRQRFPHSGVTCLIELMLKFVEPTAPDLQSLEAVLPLGWRSLINQKVGGMVLRRMEWERPMFRHVVAAELGCARPVGLLLNEPAQGAEPARQRGWAVVRLNEVRPFLFADLVGKNHELGGGEGRFTAKRNLRLDEIDDREVAAVLYFEPAAFRWEKEAATPRLLPAD